MTVYVDDAIHPFGRMLFCHLFADTVEELLAMVDTIGVQRKWIQGHPTLSFGKHRNASWVHFDISKGKRALAVQAGAIAVDRYECLVHVARRDLASGDPYLIAHARKKIAMVTEVRGRKNHAGHILFETRDSDAPDVIKDRNGEVVLGLCRFCNRGEIDLSEPCDARPMRFSANWRRL